MVRDPCTKYVATKEENAAFVVGGNDTRSSPWPIRSPSRTSSSTS